MKPFSSVTTYYSLCQPPCFSDRHCCTQAVLVTLTVQTVGSAVLYSASPPLQLMCFPHQPSPFAHAPMPSLFTFKWLVDVRSVIASSIYMLLLAVHFVVIWVISFPWYLFSGGAHVDRTQGCRENSEQREDPGVGYGRESEARDQYPEAVSASPHRPPARDHRHSQRYLHGHGEFSRLVSPMDDMRQQQMQWGWVFLDFCHNRAPEPLQHTGAGLAWVGVLPQFVTVPLSWAERCLHKSCTGKMQLDPAHQYRRYGIFVSNRVERNFQLSPVVVVRRTRSMHDKNVFECRPFNLAQIYGPAYWALVFSPSYASHK